MTNHNIPTITVHELKKRCDENSSLCLIDVREHHEWEDIRIPGALHMPKDQISEIIAANVPDHNCPVYLHCRGGVRSLYAAQCLKELGYKEVYSVEGGIMAWETSGYPVERN